MTDSIPLKKLPVGISVFQNIIENNYLYVDKTQIALNLIETGEYYFLSLPRRFGKSLFLDTLKNIFEGKKHLFEGLAIYDQYDFTPYPVIRIDLGSGNFQTQANLKQSLLEQFDLNQ